MDSKTRTAVGLCGIALSTQDKKLTERTKNQPATVESSYGLH